MDQTGRPTDNPAAYPTISRAVWLLGMTWVLTFLLEIPVAILTRAHTPARFVATGFFQALAIGVAVSAGFGRTGLPSAAVFPLAKFRLVFLGSMALLLVGAILLVADMNAMLQHLWPKPESIRELQRHILSGEGSTAAAVFIVVLVGPLTEELLFRGLILHGFLRNYGRRKAILASALLFALYHLNPWQFPVAFVLGVVLGWWLVETGSLWPCLIGHALTNSLPFLLQLALRNAPARPHPAPESSLGPLAIALLGVTASVFLVAGAWLLRRSRLPQAS